MPVFHELQIWLFWCSIILLKLSGVLGKLSGSAVQSELGGGDFPSLELVEVEHVWLSLNTQNTCKAEPRVFLVFPVSCLSLLSGSGRVVLWEAGSGCLGAVAGMTLQC